MSTGLRTNTKSIIYSRKKIVCILFCALFMDLFVPVICFADTLSFPEIGIKSISPLDNYFYLTNDMVINDQFISSLGADKTVFLSYMKQNNVKMLAASQDVSYEFDLLSYGPVGERVGINTVDYTSIYTKEELNDFFRELLTNNVAGYEINYYDTEVYEINGHTWLECYYHSKGPDIDNDVLQYCIFNGDKGSMLKMVSYNGGTRDEMRTEAKRFISCISFTDEFIKDEQTPSDYAKFRDKNFSEEDTDPTMNKDGSINWLVYIIDTVYTVLFGLFFYLGPAFVYRYLIKKKPVSRRKATKLIIIYTIVFLLINVVLYVSTQAVPLVVLLWGSVIYTWDKKILTKESKELRRATKLVRKFDKLTTIAFNGSTVLETNERYRMLGFFSIVAAKFVKEFKRDVSLSEELTEAATEQMMIQFGEKESSIIQSFVNTVNDRCRKISNEQDRTIESWFDEMINKFADVIIDYVDLTGTDDEIRRISGSLKQVYEIVNTDVEQCFVNANYHPNNQTTESTTEKACQTVEDSSLDNVHMESIKKDEDFTTPDNNLSRSIMNTPTEAVKESSPYSVKDTPQSLVNIDRSPGDKQFDEIKKWKDLLDAGIITEDEFAQKKKDLLGL